MELILNIQMDNDAFRDDPLNELEDVLLDTIVKIKDGMTYGYTIDTNGNTVGNFEIK